MIEKLPNFDSTEASIYHVEKLYAKVNQLIDAVNGILDYAPLEMAMKAEPKTESDRTRKALDIIKKETSKETMPDFAVISDALKIAEQKD